MKLEEILWAAAVASCCVVVAAFLAIITVHISGVIRSKYGRKD